MLTQLARLSVAADGRYASTKELQFLKGYFQTLDVRLSAYEKIKNAAEKIIDQVEAKMQNLDPNLLRNASGDFTKIWRKDSLRLLQYAAATMLFNDNDRLREGLLLWHTTIAKAYKFERTCKTAITLMSEVVKQYLTPEEAELFCPILGLNQYLLS